MRLRGLLLALALVLVVAVTPVFAQGTIVDEAAADGSFNTLLAAVDAAGLRETLSGPGPFTVFAPTDGAFGTLLTELNTTAEGLLADTGLLTQVLTYHVVPGTYTLADLTTLAGQRNDGLVELTTVNGALLRLTVNPAQNSATLADGRATIVVADVPASNGVIHVIDNVLLPPADGTGGASIVATEDAAATEGAAPTGGTGAQLLTLEGNPISVAVVDGAVVVNDIATVTQADITASNGVVHAIDAVLLPPAALSLLTPATEEAGAAATDAPAETEAAADDDAAATETAADDAAAGTGDTIADLVAGNPDFSILLAALQATGLDTALTTGEYTVFAPTDQAFEDLLFTANLTADDLLADPQLLAQILSYHVVPGTYASTDLLALAPALDTAVATEAAAPAATEVADDEPADSATEAATEVATEAAAG